MQGALGQLLADEATIEHPAISVEIQITAGLLCYEQGWTSPYWESNIQSS